MTTTIDLPSWFDVEAFEAQLVPELRAFPGPYGGPTEVQDLVGDRWRFSLTLPPGDHALGAQQEAFVNRLRGGAVWVNLPHFARQVPRGTLYSTTGLNASVAQGATSLVLKGVRNATNLLLYPYAFDAAPWASTAQVTANTHTAFSAALTADTVTDSSGAAAQTLVQDITVPNDSAAYTASIYVRKTSGGTSPTFVLGVSFVGGSSSIANNPRIDTDAGTVLGLGTATVTSASADYWRVAVTVTNDSTGHTTLRITLYPAFAAHGATTLDASVTGSAIVTHAQVELGTSATQADGSATLLAGDVIALAGQLLMVASDASSSLEGTLTVTVINRVRAAATSGTAVTVRNAKAAFMLADPAGVPSRYVRGRAFGPELSFVEAWA